MQEIWKNIKGYKGIYQISSFGRVKSLFRTFIDSSNRRQTIKERIMVQSINTSGYKYVPLSKNHKVKNHHIHRLLAESFIKNIYNKPQINHKDCDRLNNTINNLEWCTISENIKHAYKTKNITNWIKSKKGKENPFSKPVLQLTLEGIIVDQYDSITEANESTKIDKGDISRVCNNKRKKSAGGYKWQFQ